jgi:hypothetical protein
MEGRVVHQYPLHQIYREAYDLHNKFISSGYKDFEEFLYDLQTNKIQVCINCKRFMKIDVKCGCITE